MVAEPPEAFGKLLLELVRHLLGLGAGDLEVVGHGAVEGGGRSAHSNKHGQPEGNDQPAAPVREPAEAVQEEGHVSADLWEGVSGGA